MTVGSTVRAYHYVITSDHANLIRILCCCSSLRWAGRQWANLLRGLLNILTYNNPARLLSLIYAFIKNLTSLSFDDCVSFKISTKLQ